MCSIYRADLEADGVEWSAQAKKGCCAGWRLSALVHEQLASCNLKWKENIEYLKNLGVVFFLKYASS